MKRLLISLFVLISMVNPLSAQSLSKAIERAKAANDSLVAGVYEPALEGFKEALGMAEALGENGLELATICKGIIPKTMNAIAQQKLQSKDFDGALLTANQALLTANEYADSEAVNLIKNTIPIIYKQKGNALFEAENYAAAAEAYGEALNNDATDGVAALRYGMALEKAGKLAEAMDAYQTASKNGQKENAFALLGKNYLKRAITNLNAKKYEEALDDATVSYEYVANPQALQLAGQASQLLGQGADAVKYYKQYLQQAPDAKNADIISEVIEALSK